MRQANNSVHLAICSALAIGAAALSAPAGAQQGTGADTLGSPPPQPRTEQQPAGRTGSTGTATGNETSTATTGTMGRDTMDRDTVGRDSTGASSSASGATDPGRTADAMREQEDERARRDGAADAQRSDTTRTAEAPGAYGQAGSPSGASGTEDRGAMGSQSTSATGTGTDAPGAYGSDPVGQGYGQGSMESRGTGAGATPGVPAGATPGGSAATGDVGTSSGALPPGGAATTGGSSTLGGSATTTGSGTASDPATTSGPGTTNESFDDRTRTAEAAGAQRSDAGTDATARSGDERSGSWVLMPVGLEQQNDRLSNGCWVRLYSGEAFQGRSITLVGPNDVAQLRSPYGTGLTNWESAIVGPNATVTTFDGDDFGDRSATLRAGQRYSDLGDSNLGLFSGIESMRLRCGTDGQGGAGTATGPATNPANRGMR